MIEFYLLIGIISLASWFVSNTLKQKFNAFNTNLITKNKIYQNYDSEFVKALLTIGRSSFGITEA